MRPAGLDDHAVNALYDHGSDLVEAAGALRRAAEQPGGGAAAPAVLGCVEAALAELREATAALEARVGSTLGDHRPHGAAHQAATRRARMRQGLANLEVALDDAASAAAAARSLAARALGAALERPRHRR